MNRRLEELVARLTRREAARSEAMVQADVRQLLLDAPLGLSEDVLLETHTEDHRRIDVEVGTTVIEVKKDLSTGSVRIDAVEQLHGYVEARQRKHGTRYVGVLTDGAEWHCFHLGVVPGEQLQQKVTSFSVHAHRPDVDGLRLRANSLWSREGLCTANPACTCPRHASTIIGR